MMIKKNVWEIRCLNDGKLIPNRQGHAGQHIGCCVVRR